jgi:hypothetical protein
MALTDEEITKFKQSEVVKSISSRFESSGTCNTISLSLLSFGVGREIMDEDDIKTLVRKLSNKMDDLVEIDILWSEGLLQLKKLSVP